MRGLKKRSSDPMDPRRAKFEVGDIIDVVWKSPERTEGTVRITGILLHECGKGSCVIDDSGNRFGSFQVYSMQQLTPDPGREHIRVGISVVEDIWEAKPSKTGRILFG